MYGVQLWCLKPLLCDQSVGLYFVAYPGDVVSELYIVYSGPESKLFKSRFQKTKIQKPVVAENPCIGRYQFMLQFIKQYSQSAGLSTFLCTQYIQPFMLNCTFSDSQSGINETSNGQSNIHHID